MDKEKENLFQANTSQHTFSTNSTLRHTNFSHPRFQNFHLLDQKNSLISKTVLNCKTINLVTLIITKMLHPRLRVAECKFLNFSVILHRLILVKSNDSDLAGEFSSGSEHQGPDPRAARLPQAVQYGQDECQSLTGACRRAHAISSRCYHDIT